MEVIKTKSKVYQGVYHALRPIDKPEKFHKDIQDSIVELQDKGFLVEIQYQQSGRALSALILPYTWEYR